ncbi:MAG: glycosyltransferase [Ktedonobacterales bacterium]
MIESANPDYQNTPASGSRPAYCYFPLRNGTPLVSVITPYYNVGPVFLETVRCVQRVSYPHWEWVIVDDGSTKPESLEQLQMVAGSDQRIKVISESNHGPSAARNCGVAAAQGRYLLQLDADDMVEPTFVEKALWVMETQPQFAACSAYNVTFGSHQQLWDHGFASYELNLTKENFLTSQAMIRRDAFLEAGGYDESIRHGHEDWDFWLNLAEAGLWGYTIPEHLTWYRTSYSSRHWDTAGDDKRHEAFHAWLLKKHDRLRGRFPHPVFCTGADQPYPAVKVQSPISNPLAKPEGTRRILLLAPRRNSGEADTFNLALVRALSCRGCDFTVVASQVVNDAGVQRFAEFTPDVFILPNFLQYADYPRFLSYLIESRQMDAVLIGGSELGYGLVPFLRTHHPQLAILDSLGVEEADMEHGSFPWMSLQLRSQLDLTVTATDRMREWMVSHGAPPEQVAVLSPGVAADGIEMAISAAVKAASSRSTPAIDSTLACHSASVALEVERLTDTKSTADYDTGTKHKAHRPRSLGDIVRLLRKFAAPDGTRRHKVYKTLRRRLLPLVRGHRRRT